MNSPDSIPFFEGFVSDIMSDGSAIALIQPWYVSVKTTAGGTGMSLGGIGSAITATPAGTTPSFHFIPGRFIESTDHTPVRFTNFFFRERVLSYDRLRILDLKTFRLYLNVTPLVDPDGNRYFDADASPDVLERTLARIIDCPTFYRDNKAGFSRWDLSFSDETRQYLDTPDSEHKRLNFNILLDIFPDCLSGENDYVTALTGDVESKWIDGCRAYPAQAMYYRCLYPLSETFYGSPGHKCRILKRHISPMAIGEPKLCSLPLFHTEFVIENPTDETIDIALLQIQENISGYEIVKSRPNEQDAVFYLQRSVNGQLGEETRFDLKERGYFKGVSLKQKPSARRGDIDGAMHLGIYCDSADRKTRVSVCGSHLSEKNSTNFLNALRSGRIQQRLQPSTFTGKEPSSGGVCVSRILKPGESVRLSFFTVLDFPHIRLQDYSTSKKYVEHFPDPDSRLRTMLEYYLSCRDSDVPVGEGFCKNFIELLTRRLPRPVLKLKCIDQLAQLLANSLSFLPEAAIWDDRNFFVRECVDYPFFNSLDVYFYGSFGLMYFLPQVDTAVIKAFSDSVPRESSHKRRFSIYNRVDTGELPEQYRGVRKLAGAVPHDMGSTFDPQPNSYTWNDSKTWKDLAPKYVLLVLRNYRYTNDLKALKANWRSVNCALEFLADRIEPCHNIPFVDGVGDTFDNIKSHGISIYCASLWIAGLKAAAEIARILKEEEARKKYAKMAEAAQDRLRSALWDDQKGYYHYYSVPLSVADVDPKQIGAARAVFDRLGIGHDFKSDPGVNEFVTAANRYIYDAAAVVPAVFLETCAGLANIKDKSVSWTSLDFKSRKAIRKHALYTASGGLIRQSFEKKILQESDDIFADQLIADLYLSLLDLEPITAGENRKRVLQNIFYINYKTNSPDIGAANLVTADGKSLPEPQAQDVWVGVQHSIAANLLDCGMFDEFDDLMMVLYKNIYGAAKIPFGVPEAFNGNSGFSHQYLEEHLSISSEVAESIINGLQEIGILSASLSLVQDCPQDKWDMIPVLLRRHGLPDMSGALSKLLKASSIKYTAGRYFRAGMVFSIMAVMDKLYRKPGRALQDSQSLPEKQYVFSGERMESAREDGIHIGVNVSFPAAAWRGVFQKPARAVKD